MSGPSDPWALQRWAFEQKTGSPGRKAVLSHLAMNADLQTGECYPSMELLANGSECSQRSVRRHLIDLESAGLISSKFVPTDTGRRKVYTVLAPWVAEGPARLDGTGSGQRTQGGPATTGRACKERPGELPTDRPRAGDAIPDDFPDELRPHARSVMSLFRQVAEEHGAKAVTARAVARVVMANSRKALVAEAYAMAAYYEGKVVKDVVSTYRNWLRRADDMAGVERLDERGLPVQPGPRGVVGGSGGKASGMDGLRALHAKALAEEAGA